MRVNFISTNQEVVHRIQSDLFIPICFRLLGSLQALRQIKKTNSQYAHWYLLRIDNELKKNQELEFNNVEMNIF